MSDTVIFALGFFLLAPVMASVGMLIFLGGRTRSE